MLQSFFVTAMLAPGRHLTFRRTVGGPSNRAGRDFRTRQECWGATSVDGRWRFDRLDAPGTPWLLTYQPERGGRMPVYDYFTSLTRARVWVHAHGDAWLRGLRLGPVCDAERLRPERRHPLHPRRQQPDGGQPGLHQRNPGEFL